MKDEITLDQSAGLGSFVERTVDFRFDSDAAMKAVIEEMRKNSVTAHPFLREEPVQYNFDTSRALKSAMSEELELSSSAGLGSHEPLEFSFDQPSSNDSSFAKSALCKRKFKAGDKVKLSESGTVLLTEISDCGSKNETFVCIKWRGIDHPGCSGRGFFHENELTAA